MSTQRHIAHVVYRFGTGGLDAMVASYRNPYHASNVASG